MDLAPELAAELQALEQKWDAVEETRPTPRSTMQVIEYGLGKQRRAEVYVNRLLQYLLDPDEPHQMGADFLEAFLRELPAACGFAEDTYDLSNVQVGQQVPVENRDDESASQGYLDLLLEVPNEWFLLVELKFAAPETGTEFYCDATHLDGRETSNYESGQYYLYLHRHDKPTASSECFANWTWGAFIDDLLDDFIAANATRYPQRTVTQLYDLRDDLEEITGMSDQQDIDQRKVELYLDHFEAISDVATTFDDAWNAYLDRWDEELAMSLDDRSVSYDPREDHTVLHLPREGGETERWLCRNRDDDWQHLFKHGWWIREETGESLERRADDYDDLRIGFYHRMGESHRNRQLRTNELTFDFRCMGSNPTEFRDIYNECFTDRKAEIEELIASTNGNLTGQKRTLIEGTYKIEVDAYEEFFDAYTAALRTAFVDFVVDNVELVNLLEDIFEDAVARYEK